jgi:hypothetical protein
VLPVCSKRFIDLPSATSDGGIRDEKEKSEQAARSLWVYFQAAVWSGGYLRLHADLGSARICRQLIPPPDCFHRKWTGDRLNDEWGKPISRHPVRGSAGGSAALEAAETLRILSRICPPSDSIRQCVHATWRDWQRELPVPECLHAADGIG